MDVIQQISETMQGGSHTLTYSFRNNTLTKDLYSNNYIFYNYAQGTMLLLQTFQP